jgi:hypothetical protein
MPTVLPLDPPPEPLGWICSWQDWSGHRFGLKPPPAQEQWFPTRAEAAAHKAKLREQHPHRDFLVCILPASLAPKRKPKAVVKPRHRN